MMSFISNIETFFSKLWAFSGHPQKTKRMTFVASFLHGLLLKILLVFLAMVYFSINARLEGEGNISFARLKSAYPNGVGTYSITKYISALIVAPLIENLAFPIFVWAQVKLKFSMILGVLSLGFLMYLAHGQGSGGVTGGAIFILMFVQYLGTLKLYGEKSAYWFTVVTHFAFNLTTIAIAFLLSFIVLNY